MNRLIDRSLALLCLFSAPALFSAAAEPQSEPVVSDMDRTIANADDPELLPADLATSLTRIAERKLAERLPDEARAALYQALDLRPGAEVEKPALLLLADCYRFSGNPARAAAILERVLQDYPGAHEVPRVLLILGRTYREMGTESLALARFYAVLNATLKISPNHLEEYQLVARTAQFEIAETHLTSGRFEEASKYFHRLSLIDLAPEDRARARYKTAYASFLGSNYEQAVEQLESFLEDYAESADEAEARFLLSVSLEKLGRDDASLAAALQLFDQERIPETYAANWRYWQRRTGNHLANEFFHKGRLAAAHSLYSQLADLSDEPEWRAPALYQVGLSAERLGHVPAALEAYEQVMAIADETQRLGDLASMAEWRRAHLDWTQQFESKQRRLLGPALLTPSFAAGDWAESEPEASLPGS